MATHRIYYDDSFARDFTASVLSCEPEVYNSASAWSIFLDRTALYPTSGGQPHDLGKLGEANVLDVRDEGDEIAHIVDKPLEPGSVAGCVDWIRRFDHMQQHSGQHLLSAMFQERFGLPTVSFHLGVEICTIDVRGREPSDAILEGAERAANEVVFEDRPVTVRYGTAEALSEIGVRKEVERSGILRAIEIERADLQPCGGTHVKRTGQIGVILVRRATKVRQDWRVEFVCGRRAERMARRDFGLLRTAAERLGCAQEDVVAAAERVIVERDAHFKAVRGAQQRLAEADAVLAVQTTPAGSHGVRVISRMLSDDLPAEYGGFFATQLAKFERTMVLLAVASSGHLIFAQHPSAGQDVNAVLQQVLKEFGGKGGGTRDFARGRLSDAAKANEAVARAGKLLSDVTAERNG